VKCLVFAKDLGNVILKNWAILAIDGDLTIDAFWV
jgi:hypothetical protein